MDLMLPKIDIAFKLLFGDERNRDLLIDFLKAVLPELADEEIEELDITDPHLKPEFSGDKLEILDVMVRTKRGKVIGIEIQICAIAEMRSRVSYYQADMLTGQLGEGEHYSDLKRVISIIITDYDFIPESKRYHTVFGMLEKQEHFPFNDLMEIHVLNLRRLPEDEEGKLVNWLRFIGAEEEEEIKMAAVKNPMIDEAYRKLQVMSKDAVNRRLYTARLKAQRDEYSRIQGALREGREEGRKEGRKEGREDGQKEGEANATRKIVLEMGKSGLDITTIAAITHLSEQDINRILNKA
jgi:predicted transposase/invertase (TIGR01784 family)